MISSTEKAYLAGFFDSSSSITLVPCKDKESRLKWFLFPKVSISRTCRDRRATEELISLFKAFFDERNIVYTEYYWKRKRDGSIVLFLIIQNRKSLETFLKEVYPFLILKRRQAKIMLEDILPALRKSRQKSKRDFLRTMEEAEKLKLLHPRRRKRKYDLEYFRRLWS